MIFTDDKGQTFRFEQDGLNVWRNSFDKWLADKATESGAEVRDCTANGDASGINDHLAVQYNITGEGEGAFYMEVKDGQIDVQPYDYRDRDILVTADAQTILDMMSGKLDMVYGTCISYA